MSGDPLPAPIPPHWDFIAAAYAISALALAALTIGVVVNLMRWAKAARDEEAR